MPTHSLSQIKKQKRISAWFQLLVDPELLRKPGKRWLGLAKIRQVPYRLDFAPLHPPRPVTSSYWAQSPDRGVSRWCWGRRALKANETWPYLWKEFAVQLEKSQWLQSWRLLWNASRSLLQPLWQTPPVSRTHPSASPLLDVDISPVTINERSPGGGAPPGRGKQDKRTKGHSEGWIQRTASTSWSDGIIDSMDVNLPQLQEMGTDGKAWCAAATGSQRAGHGRAAERDNVVRISVQGKMLVVGQEWTRQKY